MLIVMELSDRLWKIIIQSGQGKPSSKCWANDRGPSSLRSAADLGEDWAWMVMACGPIPLEQWGEGEQASSRVQQKQRWGWGECEQCVQGTMSHPLGFLFFQQLPHNSRHIYNRLSFLLLKTLKIKQELQILDLENYPVMSVPRGFGGDNSWAKEEPEPPRQNSHSCLLEIPTSVYLMLWFGILF